MIMKQNHAHTALLALENVSPDFALIEPVGE